MNAARYIVRTRLNTNLNMTTYQVFDTEENKAVKTFDVKAYTDAVHYAAGLNADIVLNTFEFWKGGYAAIAERINGFNMALSMAIIEKIRTEAPDVYEQLEAVS